MPKIDIDTIAPRLTSAYPPPYDQATAGREKRALGDAGGLNDFGVNLLLLRPGAASALRHWHVHEDEFVYVLSGEVVLIEDEGETLLRLGDAAAFPKNAPNGHQLINRSDADAVLLEVGTRADEETAYYSDIDMKVEKRDGAYAFTRKSGEPL